MRKEIIFAIIVGTILGGIILYGVQLANSSAKEATMATPQAKPDPALQETPTPQLAIISPLDHSVVSVETLEIIGKSIPNSSIAIQSDKDDALVTSDASGNFKLDFKLAGGENIIEITSLSPNQEVSKISLVVIYTTAKIN